MLDYLSYGFPITENKTPLHSTISSTYNRLVYELRAMIKGKYFSFTSTCIWHCLSLSNLWQTLKALQYLQSITIVVVVIIVILFYFFAFNNILRERKTLEVWLSHNFLVLRYMELFIPRLVLLVLDIDFTIDLGIPNFTTIPTWKWNYDGVRP